MDRLEHLWARLSQWSPSGEDLRGRYSTGLMGGGACPEAHRSAMVSLQALDVSEDSSDGRATTTMKKATTTMKKRKSGSNEGKGGDSPSQLIDGRIKELSDW